MNIKNAIKVLKTSFYAGNYVLDNTIEKIKFLQKNNRFFYSTDGFIYDALLPNYEHAPNTISELDNYLYKNCVTRRFDYLETELMENIVTNNNYIILDILKISYDISKNLNIDTDFFYNEAYSSCDLSKLSIDDCVKNYPYRYQIIEKIIKIGKQKIKEKIFEELKGRCY